MTCSIEHTALPFAVLIAVFPANPKATKSKKQFVYRLASIATLLVLVRNVLPTPEQAEKAPAPAVERFFSPAAAAARLLLNSDAFETSSDERAELKLPVLLGWPLRLRNPLRD